jgi:hypothetical protein
MRYNYIAAKVRRPVLTNQIICQSLGYGNNTAEVVVPHQRAKRCETFTTPLGKAVKLQHDSCTVVQARYREQRSSRKQDIWPQTP